MTATPESVLAGASRAPVTARDPAAGGSTSAATPATAPAQPAATGPLRPARVAPVAAVLALGGFAGVLGLVVTRRTDRFDLAVSAQLQRRWPARLDGPIRAASWPGFPPQSRIIPPLVIATWWWRGHRRAAVLQGAAWGTGLLSTAIKRFVRRPRPLPEQVKVLLHKLSGTSFPSGHVLTYTGFYGFLAYLLHRHARPPAAGRAGAAALIGLIGVVGPSRIYQGHHWATDVLSSYLLGLAYVLGLVAIYERICPETPESRPGPLPARSHD